MTTWRDLTFVVIGFLLAPFVAIGFLLALFIVHWMNSPDEWDED